MRLPFHRDYVAMTTDGAEWLADHTDVELVGIDYTSIAYWGDLKGPHVALFKHVSTLTTSSHTHNRAGPLLFACVD